MTIRISMRPRGPFVVENEGAAPLEILRADGTRVELPNARKVRLCRCGASAHKPLCDGSHDRIGFEAPAGDDEREAGAGER